ncbi:D-Ala-D-Ala carboxypeptidase family metallohydrolase, partial [Klebsiella pneumoniae]
MSLTCSQTTRLKVPSQTAHFKAAEWRCKCSRCNKQVAHKMLPKVMEAVEAIRVKAGRPLALNSAYRCARHPEEAKKAKPGQHNAGTAVDIRVSGGAERLEIIKLGLEFGATGIGVANGFVHLDWR